MQKIICMQIQFFKCKTAILRPYSYNNKIMEYFIINNNKRRNRDDANVCFCADGWHTGTPLYCAWANTAVDNIKHYLRKWK